MTKEGGFTLVESAIAIAVSASMVLLVIGLAGTVGQQRFKDSMATAQAFIQTQYNEVRSGINGRLGEHTSDALNCSGKSGGNTAAASSDDCYIAGRLMTFHKDEITSSYVIIKKNDGNKDKWPNYKKSAIKNLTEGVTLYVISGTSSDAGLSPVTKNIGYGSEIKRAWYIDDESVSAMGSDGHDPNLALLRSPVDGALIAMTDVSLSDGGPGGTKTLSIPTGDQLKVNMLPTQRVALGIQSGSWGGAADGLICIAGGDNSTGISNNYNVGLNWSDLDGGDNQTKIKDACKNWETNKSTAKESDGGEA